MDEKQTHSLRLARNVLNAEPGKPEDDLRGKAYTMDDDEASDEVSTPLTAPQTPSGCKASDITARMLRFSECALEDKDHASAGRAPEPLSARETARPSQQTGDLASQGSAMSCEVGTSCETCSGLPYRRAPSLLSGHKLPASQLNGFPVPGRGDTNSSNPQLKVLRERQRIPMAPGRRIDCSGRQQRKSQRAAEYSNQVQESSVDVASGAVCLSAGNVCLQELLEQYRHRRSAFEKNCSQRYERILEAAMHTRRAGSFWKLAVGGKNIDERQRCRLSPAQAGQRKSPEGDGAEPTTSSSGEEATSRGVGDTGESSTAAEGGAHFSEHGIARRAKGTGHRSFPYRQFHVHHFLPEPENKVGLLTHPTPAQFNKYPKARGVWFDPHRNLVRTCWKENGKARTMGFPVNKFGLEEARTLAVEYHYYKCPTDPLPDDLSSLVPRKPPHAYGWC